MEPQELQVPQTAAAIAPTTVPGIRRTISAHLPFTKASINFGSKAFHSTADFPMNFFDFLCNNQEASEALNPRASTVEEDCGKKRVIFLFPSCLLFLLALL